MYDSILQVFFVIRLHSAQAAASLPPIQDPDPLISSELMDGRDAFLTMARERHYEFSSLRRCKYSTMAMLYELHNQARDNFVYSCNNCQNNVETRYHCGTCDVSSLVTLPSNSCRVYSILNVIFQNVINS